MTLLQRNRENIELGRVEGTISATKILKLYKKGVDNENISSYLRDYPKVCVNLQTGVR